MVTCGDYRKRHQPTPHYAWLWILVQAVNRTPGRSGSASEDDPAERGCRIEDDTGLNANDAWRIAYDASLGGHYEQRAATSSTVTDQRRKNFFVRKSSFVIEVPPNRRVLQIGDDFG